MWNPPSREAKTGIACATCGEALDARRTCREAYLYCPRCRERREIRDYLPQMDSVLEAFLEALNCDRI